jgi:hypothetical protein
MPCSVHKNAFDASAKAEIEDPRVYIWKVVYMLGGK